jgi:UDP-3-O-[3-hydroxymyristoyl] glucosamine N-acyltransferase
MGKQLLLIGSGDFANEVALIAKRIDPKRAIWERISYVATDRAEIGEERQFGRVDYCDEDVLSGALKADAAIALGASHLRMRVAERYAKTSALTFPNLIDPGNDHDPELIKMGMGNIVHRNVTMTYNVVMGDFNFFNKSSTIGHDTVFGSFNTVSPNATLLRNVHLGNCCMIGANACLMPEIRIADRTTVEACALLRHDVDEPGHIFTGVPAQRQA